MFGTFWEAGSLRTPIFRTPQWCRNSRPLKIEEKLNYVFDKFISGFSQEIIRPIEVSNRTRHRALEG